MSVMVKSAQAIKPHETVANVRQSIILIAMQQLHDSVKISASTELLLTRISPPLR